MKTRESSIEKKLTAYAESLGLMAFKFVSPGKRGVPDRLFIRPGGEVLFLEIKAPGEKPNPVQLRMMEKLRKQGVCAGWVDNYFDGSCGIQSFANQGWQIMNIKTE